MILFDGNTEGARLEAELKAQVEALGRPIRISAVLFIEDSGSQIYTQLKREAAQRVGMEYSVEQFSLRDEAARVVAAIDRCNRDWQVTGVIVQKPAKATWMRHTGRSEMEYQLWWKSIMGAVSPSKDVDGLHPATIASIATVKDPESEVILPATCRAVLHVLSIAREQLALTSLGKIVILGKTDLVGIPLHAVLQKKGEESELLNTKAFASRMESGEKLLDADVVVSATGKANLIVPDMLRDGVLLLDVGEPRPDIQRYTYAKARFVSPVPGGVGPLTVQFLLRNALTLATHNN